jgi:hypothetical protein
MSGFSGNRRRYAYQDGTLYIETIRNVAANTIPRESYELKQAKGNSLKDHVTIERYATRELAQDAKEALELKQLKDAAKGKRKVFPTDEIPHLWAHQITPEARNAGRNLYFKGATIYSYGSHFPIARHVTSANGKRKAVLFTTRDYSNTTSKHKHLVRCALPAETIRFYVPQVDVGAFSRNHNLAYFIREMGNEWIKAQKSIKYGASHIASMRGLLANAKAYAKFFGASAADLKLPATPKQIRELQTKIAARETKRKQREQWAAENPSEAQRIRQEAFAKRNAAAIAKYENEKQEWYAGERSHFPQNPALKSWQQSRNAELRIVTVAESSTHNVQVVQTSLGVSVPIDHAIRGLRLVRAVMQSGREYKRNGHTEHLGPYAVDSIAIDGTLKAECHVITWDSIARIAPALDSIAAYMGKDGK